MTGDRAAVGGVLLDRALSRAVRLICANSRSDISSAAVASSVVRAIRISEPGV